MPLDHQQDEVSFWTWQNENMHGACAPCQNHSHLAPTPMVALRDVIMSCSLLDSSCLAPGPSPAWSCVRGKEGEGERSISSRAGMRLVAWLLLVLARVHTAPARASEVVPAQQLSGWAPQRHLLNLPPAQPATCPLTQPRHPLPQQPHPP